uniref:SitA5 family polymorphic toxin n=1 Tax=Hyalangium gracile TaxID=394092 RepID=UPI001CC8F337|nr:hypothetical protein [Hyalangium gracile]
MSVPTSGRPDETARLAFEMGLEADLLAEVEHGRVVRMTPLEENTPLLAPTAAAVTREYLGWCAKQGERGDCLGLLVDGATLRRDDLRTLTLALAFGPVLEETKHALKEMVSPQALLAMVVWTASMYLMLWVLPEPLSKGLAALLTVSMLAWLGVDTVWSLMSGWVQLVEETHRATTFAQLRMAGEKYSRVLGQNAARVLVMLITVALGGTAATFTKRLPQLPGFSRAAVQIEAQAGIQLAEAGLVESVAASPEGAFSIAARSVRGKRGTASQGAPATTIMRHREGNRQVTLNGQRWHVPAGRSIKEVPATDPVGDQLQAAATEAARRWNPRHLSEDEAAAIERAVSRGEYWKAKLWERAARGKFVEEALRKQFGHLRWSRTGVDALDPATGCRYEILSGTQSNMADHGRRMRDTLFRMITF